MWTLGLSHRSLQYVADWLLNDVSPQFNQREKDTKESEGVSQIRFEEELLDSIYHKFVNNREFEAPINLTDSEVTILLDWINTWEDKIQDDFDNAKNPSEIETIRNNFHILDNLREQLVGVKS